MCGRFNLHADPRLLAEIFQLLREPDWPRARYNIEPSQPILVVRADPGGTRSGDLIHWGLIPRWAKEATSIMESANARSESVATKPFFKEAFRKRRCLIPVSGFYEWQRVSPKVKQPWHIYPKSGELLTFAGIWETGLNRDGETVDTCAILTTSPNAVMGAIHDRMPVILPSEAFETWLDPKVTEPEVLQPLLVPCPDDWLRCDPVGTFVNKPGHDSVECIKPVKLARGLFD